MIDCTKAEYFSPFNNDYIKRLNQSEDLHYSNRILRKYRIVKRLQNFKLFKADKILRVKNVLPRVLNRYKKKIHFDFIDELCSFNYERENYSETDDIKVDINFKQLYVYDLVPKENLKEYEKGLIKFLSSCKYEIGTADEKFIKEQFYYMLNCNFKNANYFLGIFLINDKSEIKEWIDKISIAFEEYGSMFYIVKYSLTLNQRATNELKLINNSLVLEIPIFTKRSVKNRFSAKTNINLLWRRQDAIEKLILEIENNFLRNINKWLPCYFHSHNLISPTLSLYTVNSFRDAETVLEVLNFDKKDYDKSENNEYLFNINVYGYGVKNNSCIVDISKVKDLDRRVDNYVFFPFELARYYVSLELQPTIEQEIIKNQANINALSTKKHVSANKMLKAKVKAIKNLVVYERIIDAVINFDKRLVILGYNLQIKSNLSNCEELTEEINAYEYNQKRIENKYLKLNEMCSSLFKYFDKGLTATESSANLKLIRWTLGITIFASLISLMALLVSFHILDPLIEIVKNYFSS